MPLEHRKGEVGGIQVSCKSQGFGLNLETFMVQAGPSSVQSGQATRESQPWPDSITAFFHPTVYSLSPSWSFSHSLSWVKRSNNTLGAAYFPSHVAPFLFGFTAEDTEDFLNNITHFSITWRLLRKCVSQ